ncbi:MAG: hypothetical protein LUM44_22560 [Pyrinomonadaceae bacterium]|nr:hypothetical protein [Pyrinomonadaceae bacterium]
MKKTLQPRKEDFDAFLNWLSPDSEEAGKEYEQIRKGLIRFYDFRGCSDLEFLADETINRVIWKFSSLDLSKNTRKITIFYNFGFYVFREYIKHFTEKEVQLDPDWEVEDNNPQYPEDSDNNGLNCLDKCLDKLSPNEKRLILTYYSEEKSAKTLVRKNLANELNIKLETLHVRACRIKESLRNCVEECVKK